MPGLVRERGLEGYAVEELSPQYIAEGTWRNSTDQRRRMVEYLAENLKVTGIPRTKRAPVGVSLFESMLLSLGHYGQCAVPLR